jgi:hypothetical protein
MRFHVVRNSEELGAFSSEEILDGLRSGRFVATDLAWREGAADWTPLGEWAEFRGVVSPGAAAEPVSQGDLAPSWERSRSLTSAFATLVLAVHRPASALSGARLAFGSTLLLCWLLLLAASVFSIAGGYLHAEHLARSMKDAGSEVSEIAMVMQGPLRILGAEFAEYLSSSLPRSLPQVAMHVLLMVAVAPFCYLLLGALQWFGLRLLGLCGMKSCRMAEFGRTSVAGMLALAIFFAVNTPLDLLTPLGVAYGYASQACKLLGAILYCRALGGALQVNPWAVFLSAVLSYGATAYCCCSVFGLIIGFLAW